MADTKGQNTPISKKHFVNSPRPNPQSVPHLKLSNSSSKSESQWKSNDQHCTCLLYIFYSVYMKI